jgi:hypothetical protein
MVALALGPLGPWCLYFLGAQKACVFRRRRRRRRGAKDATRSPLGNSALGPARHTTRSQTCSLPLGNSVYHLINLINATALEARRSDRSDTQRAHTALNHSIDRSHTAQRSINRHNRHITPGSSSATVNQSAQQRAQAINQRRSPRYSAPRLRHPTQDTTIDQPQTCSLRLNQSGPKSLEDAPGSHLNSWLGSILTHVGCVRIELCF